LPLFTQLPRRGVLGNPASGVRDSRKLFSGTEGSQNLFSYWREVLSTRLPGYRAGPTRYPNRERERGFAKLMHQYGARNQISARVSSIKTDEVMSLVKFEVSAPAQMASVLTTESVEDLDLKEGDEVQLVIKAVHVLPIKG